MEHGSVNDARSSFLQLPAELRSKIYIYVLGGHIIHVGGTGHQPYSEGHLPNGRSSSCVAQLSDEACYSTYTLRGKALQGAFPEDRFSKRHRDCHHYPVSHRLKLDILSVCKQIRSEASGLEFEENVFTLARPHSLPPFLARLTTSQLASIRSIKCYSADSDTTWITPAFGASEYQAYLTGFRSLHIYMELRPFHTVFAVMRPWRDQRLRGLSTFQLKGLREVEVMILTPDWDDPGVGELSGSTLELLKQWEQRIVQMMLPLAPLQQHLRR